VTTGDGSRGIPQIEVDRLFAEETCAPIAATLGILSAKGQTRVREGILRIARAYNAWRLQGLRDPAPRELGREIQAVRKHLKKLIVILKQQLF
jgi:hypothetical protein